jgi:phytoene dehydrogenase-like protein
MTDRTNIVVVGGGVAGLVAAATVASTGLGVFVLDAHPSGGRARSTEQAGFTLNTGAHALYAAGAFQRELSRLGVTPTGGSPAVGGAMVSIGRKLHRLPTGGASLVRTGALSNRGRVAFGTLMGRLARKDPAALAGRTVREWLAGLPDDAVAIVEALVRLSSYTDAADTFDAGAAIAQLRLGAGGVRYVDGGWQSIVEALRAIIMERGGAVVEGDQVLSVDRSDQGYVVGATDRSIVADAVILAVGGPETTARLVGAPVPGVDRLGPIVQAAVLDLGMPSASGPRAPIVLGVDRPLYLSVHAPVARLAPPGSTLVSVMKYLPPGQPAGETGAVREELLTHADRAGIRRESLVLERYLRALVVHHGVPLARHGGLAGRPGVDALGALDRPGVFMAGDWVGPEGMLADAAAASGAVAARLAIRHVAGVAA